MRGNVASRASTQASSCSDAGRVIGHICGRVVALVLVAGFPVRYRSEGDVLSDGDGVRLRARGLALLLSELCPLLSLSHTGVYNLLDDRLLDAPGGLVFLAVFADAVGDDCL